MNYRFLVFAVLLVFAGGLSARASVQITAMHNDDVAAATQAKLTMVDGEKEPKGGDVEKLRG